MQPVLFSLLGYPVKSYGFFLALAHAAGFAAILLLARRRGLSLAPLIDLFFISIAVGLLGARALYALAHWEEFAGRPSALLSLQQGGLSLFGGFVPAWIAFMLGLRWKRLPVLEYADTLCPALPFSVAVIRVGCFLQGCCYGAPYAGATGLVFTHEHSQVPPALRGLLLHPTQLYEMVFLLLLTGALLLARRRLRLPPGWLGTFTVAAYCVYRFVMDFHRGDLERGLMGVEWLTVSQAGSLLGLLSAPFVLYFASRSRKKEGSPLAGRAP